MQFSASICLPAVETAGCVVSTHGMTNALQSDQTCYSRAAPPRRQGRQPPSYGRAWMLYVSRWKTIAVVFTCLASLLFTLPNFFSKTTVQRWPAWLPRMQLPLGLDLSGGAHLLLAMDTGEVHKDWLDTVRDDARRRLRDAKIALLGSASPIMSCRCAWPSPRTPTPPSRRCKASCSRPATSSGHHCHRPPDKEGRGRRDHGSLQPRPACRTASPMRSAPRSRQFAAVSTSWARPRPPLSARGETGCWCSSRASRIRPSSRH